jgi:hypothetical protein
MTLRQLDYRELAEVARDYYDDHRTQDSIARERHQPQTTIGSWLRRARDLGIVSIDVDSDFAVVGQDLPRLRRRLISAFDLNDAVVVDAPPQCGATGTRDDSEATLHTAVANGTGNRLREWIQADDHVGVAGGRAVVQVARCLKRRRRTSPRRNVHISPLCGRIWQGRWQLAGATDLQRPLDADDAATLLAFAFEHDLGTKFSIIGHSLYPPVPPRRLAEICREHCAFLPESRWNWDLAEPDRAIVGIGILDKNSGHRLMQFLGSDRHPDAHLPRLGRELEAIIATARAHGTCVGDVANRLFPALPLPTQSGVSLPSEEDLSLLCAKIDRLNRKALVIDWNHLRSIRSTWAVCAGRLKLPALWTVLLAGVFDRRQGRAPLVDHVSVDAGAAKELLEAKVVYDQNDSTRKAYDARLALMFRA